MMTYVNQLCLCCYRTILWCYRAAYYFFLRIYSHHTPRTYTTSSPLCARLLQCHCRHTAFDEQPLRTDDVT